MSYDNNNRGALFRAREKKNDNSPDYSGNCEINGVEMWIAAWIKESKAGTKYMSLSFTPKEERREQAPESQDDDIPF